MTQAGGVRKALTPLQFGMLYHYLREGRDSGVDVVQVEVRLDAPVDPERLTRAWDRVVHRHPAFCLSFQWEGGGDPHALVHPRVATPVTEVDLGGEADPEEAFIEFLRKDRVRGFDLSAAPVFRLTLVRMGPDRERLVWTLHHALADGASYALVLDELLTLLDPSADPDDAFLPEPVDPAPRLDWAARRDGSGDEAFWKKALGTLGPAASLPRASGAGAGADPPGRVPPGSWTFLRERLDADATDRLRSLARAEGVTLHTLVQAAWALTLARTTGRDDVVFGAIRGGRAGTVPGADRMVGLFIGTVPVRVAVGSDRDLGGLLGELREGWVAMRGHAHASPADMHAWSGAQPGSLLFESVLNYQEPFWGEALLERDGPGPVPVAVDLHNPLVYPLTVAVNASDELSLRFEFDPGTLDEGRMREMLALFRGLLVEMSELEPARLTSQLTLGALRGVSATERERVVVEWNRTERELPPFETVHEAFAARVREAPGAPALRVGDSEWSYGELDRAAGAVAAALAERGVGRGDRVAVALRRGPGLVPALLGVLRAGAAYVPVDPGYPPDRVRLMLEDAKPAAILTDRASSRGLPPAGVPVVTLEEIPGAGDSPSVSGSAPGPVTGSVPGAKPAPPPVTGTDPAYVIYTSGSTGRPKGVVVEHRNVLNFFAGMDDRVGTGPGDRWLAVTSISFDISVLELLWTLSRGACVVLHGDRGIEGAAARSAGPATRSAGAATTPPASGPATTPPAAGPAFSLFYFSAEGEEGQPAPAPGRHRYRLLLEGARFADEHGFTAVWTPERHFHEFGGIYPNPSVAGAAIAAITRNVRIRAGSVVLPLHDTIRVAEEWSVVDNLSDGRVDLAFASGWHDRDFVLAPERFEGRRADMPDRIAELQRLWQGGAVEREGPGGRTHSVTLHPRPVQPVLPVWITAGGSPETFREAGASGANLLTHLLGQSPAELGEKIRIYREARAAAGHAGPGHVSLMLHTFIGTDAEAVRERVRDPFRNYLRTSVGLLRAVAAGEGLSMEGAKLTEAEMEALLDHAFDRYYETSSLMGTVERGVEIVERMQEIGVDEIACLIDFGVEEAEVLAALPRLQEVREQVQERAAGGAVAAPSLDATPASTGSVAAPALDASPARSVSEAIVAEGITHLQCTPSQAALILAEEGAAGAVGRLRTLCIGGEAFPGSLAVRLRTLMAGDALLLNMYGPTETTIWSAVHEVEAGDAGAATVPLGSPIANTQLLVVDAGGRLVPAGVEGELLIGGAGVTRGYLGRDDLTAERFVESPAPEWSGRFYRTGDCVRRRGDGVLEFLGRLDDQIKVLGHRIEPGEIEAALVEHPAVARAVVVKRPETDQLAAWMVAAGDPASRHELRAHLAQRLPGPMIPALFLHTEAFPLTPNGKVDRRALAVRAVPGGGGASGGLNGASGENGRRVSAPAGAAPRASTPAAAARPTSTAAAAAPPSPASSAPAPSQARVEREIAAVWSELLGVEEIGPEENFFEIGGHSLLAVRVHSRLSERYGSGFSLVDLFRFPTVRALAGHLAPADDDVVARARDRGAARRAARQARLGGVGAGSASSGGGSSGNASSGSASSGGGAL